MNRPIDQLDSDTNSKPSRASWVMVALAWVLVGIPIAWGLYQTVRSAVALFR